MTQDRVVYYTQDSQLGTLFCEYIEISKELRETDNVSTEHNVMTTTAFFEIGNLYKLAQTFRTLLPHERLKHTHEHNNQSILASPRQLVCAFYSKNASVTSLMSIRI